MKPLEEVQSGRTDGSASAQWRNKDIESLKVIANGTDNLRRLDQFDGFRAGGHAEMSKRLVHSVFME